jgi:hypothetical protein
MAAARLAQEEGNDACRLNGSGAVARRACGGVWALLLRMLRFVPKMRNAPITHFLPSPPTTTRERRRR